MFSNSTDHYARLRNFDAAHIRQEVRLGAYRGQTAGLAPGRLQANLIILPSSSALDFMRFCQRNPKPCPLVGVSETGDPVLRTLGEDIDIRTDVPAYYVYRDGELTESVNDISHLWQEDHVAIALGCSFTFEDALIRAGITIWHVEHNKTVPMYRSAIQTVAAGEFSGDMVVTMRAIPANRTDEVIRICRQYPLAHGAPVHVGDPAAIGLHDLAKPEWGDVPPSLNEHEVPVFWACGVTPQIALMRAKLPLFISHQPGHMLITDIDDQAEVPIYATAN